MIYAEKGWGDESPPQKTGAEPLSQSRPVKPNGFVSCNHCSNRQPEVNFFMKSIADIAGFSSAKMLSNEESSLKRSCMRCDVRALVPPWGTTSP